MQREAKKQMQETGIGTKSQQALKLQQEQNKQERKVRRRHFCGSVITHYDTFIPVVCKV